MRLQVINTFLALNLKTNSIEKLARKAVHKVGSDTSKAVNKARRLATKAFDFDEDEANLNSSDYDLLLSAAGAQEYVIPPQKSYSQTFIVPANCAIGKYYWYY